VESLAQQFDVRGVQLSFPGEHFGDYAFPAEVGSQIALLQAMLIEEETEHVYR
jgi:hypothetical protein